MADTDRKMELPKDGMALVLGGLFILTLVFIAYRYFNRPISPETQNEDSSLLDLLEEEETNNDSIDDEVANDNRLNGDGAQDERPLGTGGSVAGTEIEITSDTWVANDYEPGNITGNTHTVQSGDTLWEIAEGAYGNGAEWTRILDANSSSIDFLANGQQSLIYPGQTLTIPR